MLEIEKFHSKTINGIFQELYAVMIMAVISRTLMVLTSEAYSNGEEELQFKNAMMSIGSDAAVLVADEPEKAIEIFNEILLAIRRVKYYRAKQKRASQPRITKKPVKKSGLENKNQ